MSDTTSYYQLIGEAKVEKNLQKVDPICEEEFGIAKLRESLLWSYNPCRGVVRPFLTYDPNLALMHLIDPDELPLLPRSSPDA